MLNLLSNLPKQAWIAITIAITCFVTPIGFGVSALLFKSGNLSYERGDTKIKIGEAKNNSEFAKKQWEQKLKQFERQLEESNSPGIQEVRETFEAEILPTAEAVIETSEELEEAIAN